ncbi:hypothetical protein [Mycetocola spongiae]|uniref:hypothetical protein n=1 Tax=Mycetocola spongiae TaxID=2859226 RepID=UPI001CF5837F|nr:hypothetical protein [Mycetocola spongiae]UCR88325.1 hypothetical protein KXZ72_10120 [Mycetocola spongiae]
MTAESHPTIWWKNQRVWRTLFSGICALLSVLPEALAIIGEQWPSEAWAGIAVQLLAVQAVLTRIMAIERVNAWLQRIGLGAAPRSALITAR